VLSQQELENNKNHCDDCNTVTHILKVEDKEEAGIIQWLQLATSKDEARPVLMGIQVKNGKTASCDGFRLHLTNTNNTPTLERFKGKILQFLSKVTKNKLIEGVEVKGNYPEYEQIFPVGEPSAIVALNAKYLSDAISFAAKSRDNKVVMKIYPGEMSPVRIKFDNGEALVMPIYLSEDDKL